MELLQTGAKTSFLPSYAIFGEIRIPVDGKHFAKGTLFGCLLQNVAFAELNGRE
jgi:hypothetical protein